MGLDINIETKHNSYYNNNLKKFHEDLDYNQMYNFVFNHDDKFWIFLTIKDVQNQNQQHMLKWSNTWAFKNINICGPSYEVYLSP
jgi:hypothetical protein